MLLNDEWRFWKEGDEETKIVSLPHDAMLDEKRDIDNPGGANISYFEGGLYNYEREFTVPHLEEGMEVYFEFEGIYMLSSIYINGEYAGGRHYGYSDYILNVTSFVKEGTNTIRIVADNSHQPNSRWYTGSGVYRPVHLFILPKIHIKPRSFKINTLDYKTGLIQVRAAFNKETASKLEILNSNDTVVYTKDISSSESIDEEIAVPSFHLWNLEDPYLYHIQLTIEEDKAIEPFGIRQIELDKEKGYLINGNRVILYGGCIHHDNGLLGAIADPFAEERRAMLLKKAGYNAIRSAHNPISRAFIDACDRIGLLIMDEFADMWYIHKTKYDYASYCMDDYKLDLLDMVDKDYNHPSVVLYSVGNEVAETSEKRGIYFVKTMHDYLHELDGTRPVTCGVNIFFNALFSMGFGVYSDKKADKEASKKPEKKKKKKSVGSEFFNDLAGKLGAGFMKTGATLPICDRKTKKAFANMDVAGYNYGIKRYKHDLKKYKDRFILGSETFCADAGKFYELAKDNPRLIGDFVWAGWDYIGEAGIGSWVAAENKDIYDDKSGWLLAGSGRIDILGNECAEMKYTRTAFRQDVISLACISPRDYELGHSPSSWKLSWAHYAYYFPGYEGKETEVEVYSQADHVELYLDEKLIGKAKKKNPDGLYSFKITYQPGTLKALAYDKDNKVLGLCLLMSAGEETIFRALPEKSTIELSDGLAYIHLQFTDENGVVKRLANEDIDSIEIEGGTLLGLGNACPYYKGGYHDGYTKAYYGKALAIVKPNKVGTLSFKAHSKFNDAFTHVEVIDTKKKKDFHI